MEKELKIKARDGKYIYGRLRGSLKKPLIIFVHGLTGHMEEHIFFNGARFFEKKGFSSFRFNLYDDPDDARKLHDCNLKVHASNLNRVAEYLKRRGVKKIYVVGHSYGAPTILLSRTENFKALVLWDGTMNPDIIYRKTMPDKIANGFIREWSYKFILGKKMVAEAKKFTDFAQAAKNCWAPVKMILAEDANAQSKEITGFFQALPGPKEKVVFKKTGHTFSEDGKEEKLFAETLKWIKKFR